MKTLTAQLVSVAMLLAQPVLVSAQVLEGDLTLRTQAEVDAFNYTEVTGSLTIGRESIDFGAPPTDIKSLNPLSTLTKVGGTLLIRNNPLQTLQGLENLSSVDELYIRNNAQLQDLQGLENLASIGGDLKLENNAALSSLQGLENLSSVYSLNIESNEKLQNLQGLDNLTTIDWSFVIAGNAALTSLQGLENLTSIGIWLEINSNSVLASLQGLENLTTIGELYITANPGLASLQGLENLTTITLDLIITNNATLISLQGLENITLFYGGGALIISDNPILNDCCAIARLLSRQVIENITIAGNGSNCNSRKVIRENCAPAINGFTLVDAATDQDIFDLDLGNIPAVINILETGNQLNIRANMAGQVGSVVFVLDGIIIRKENVAPYALFGDYPIGDYHAGMLALGRHTLTATPYQGKNGMGQHGEPLTLEFVVVDQALAVISFTLVTTHNNQDQYELKEGSTVSLQQFDPTKLNIRANTFPETVGSVVFNLNAVKNVRTENVFPYALGGDIPPGEYQDYTLTAGTYQLTATPYSMPSGQGEAGNPLNITFEVVEDAVAVTRTKSSTSPKAKDVAVKAEDISVELPAEQIWVYPNPSDEVLQVQVTGLRDSQSPLTLMLYNPLGEKVWEGTAAANRTAHIEVSHLSGGVYFLKAVGNAYSHIQRILVK